MKKFNGNVCRPKCAPHFSWNLLAESNARGIADDDIWPFKKLYFGHCHKICHKKKMLAHKSKCLTQGSWSWTTHMLETFLLMQETLCPSLTPDKQLKSCRDLSFSGHWEYRIRPKKKFVFLLSALQTFANLSVFCWKKNKKKQKDLDYKSRKTSFSVITKLHTFSNKG